ncbi:MAG: phosphotransferase [Patescibacteria group bacterium]|jgi:tRNA A-37 threonylcarbamoyl transferase component Bud32
MQEKPDKRVRLSPFERPEMRIEDKKRVLNAFTETFLDKSNQTRLGAGTTAEVMANNLDPALSKFVSKFAYADRPHHGILNDLETEFEQQLNAWRMTEGWKTKYPKAPRVRVPEPIGYVREGDNEVLVMERVRGKTLWRLLMENYLRTEGIASGRLTERDAEDLAQHPDDSYVEDFLIRRTDMAQYYQHGRHKEIEKTMWDNCYRKQSAIVTEDQFKAIQAFAALSKREKFWHRDFHPKNVMISDNGDVFVIDFGLSTQGMDEKDAMHIENFGQEIMMTAGYEGLIEQLRGSGNGDSTDPKRQRVPMSTWHKPDLDKKA